MAADEDGGESQFVVDDALEDLRRAARTPAKQRVVKVTSHVERVCAKAYEDGLSQEQLLTLVDLLTLPSELDQASIGNLIKNLYPGRKVPDACVIKVVASFGHGETKLAYPIQALLLKWLVMVYDVLENPKILSKLYAVLFDLLDTLALRAPLCHLLSLITRRKHVRPFRIQLLLEVARRANDPPLIGLLRVFKDYYPDVIIGAATTGRASVFTLTINEHPNPEWKTHLLEVQELHTERAREAALSRQNFRVTRNGVKRARTSVLPEVHTSRAQENSVTLEEIEDVNVFVAKLEKIELPNQMVAALGDPLLRKLLQLRSTPASLQRIENWLTAFFDDQDSADVSIGPLENMLGAIRDYTRYTKKLPAACMSYLHGLLGEWNGITCREVILELLTWTPIAPFEDLYASTFEPLETCLIDGTADSLLSLLSFYISLLQNWTFALLVGKKPDFSSTTFTALIEHANSLALTIHSTPTSSTTKASNIILTLYERTVLLVSHKQLQHFTRITVPPPNLIYSLYFSSSLSTISRLCGVLALYKRAFEQAMIGTHTEELPAIEAYPKAYVNQFNGFLMDICNCIWRLRAFNTTDVNALGCLLPPASLRALTPYVSSLDTALALQSLFGLSFSPVLCYLAISYVREVEHKAVEEGGNISIRHAGPVTSRSLQALAKNGGITLEWSAYRLGVLQYLERKGVFGVGELMYNTMKHLMTARENAKAA